MCTTLLNIEMMPVFASGRRIQGLKVKGEKGLILHYVSMCNVYIFTIPKLLISKRGKPQAKIPKFSPIAPLRPSALGARDCLGACVCPAPLFLGPPREALISAIFRDQSLCLFHQTSRILQSLGHQGKGFVLTLALPFSSCVTLDKSFHLSNGRFFLPHQVGEEFPMWCVKSSPSAP